MRFAYNPYKLDVAKAKALLAEAGYPNGFELRLDAPNISPWIDIAQSVQQTMGQAGIKLNIVSAELEAGAAASTAPASTRCVLTSWTPDYLDPHSNADTFAHNDDDSDDAEVEPLAWRNHWFIPDITKQDAGGGKGGRHRQAQGRLRGAAEDR